MHGNDTAFMNRAIELALQGQGYVEPNPMVGCVLVRNNRIIGEGWHQLYGGPHAEVNAITSCDDPTAATAYVTLEPCSHDGKTGACSAALIEAGITRTIIGTQDPNPQVNGGGIAQLKAAGIKVDVGVCEAEAQEIILPFAKRIRTGLPWVLAKWAMTLDGKIATATGSSQWISSESSRKIVHQIRGRMDAVIVGLGTVVADDPMLTARPNGPRTAFRVVVDSMCRIPLASQLVKTAAQYPVIVGVSADASEEAIAAVRKKGCTVFQCAGTSWPARMRAMLKYLSSKGCTNVLVEGGSAVLGALNDESLIDEVHCFIAPKISGGEKGITAIAGRGILEMNYSQRIDSPSIQQVENDVYVSGRILKSTKREES